MQLQASMSVYPADPPPDDPDPPEELDPPLLDDPPDELDLPDELDDDPTILRMLAFTEASIAMVMVGDAMAFSTSVSNVF